MISPINILVSADYELFLGRNFVSNAEVLFDPTEHMIAICDDLDVPITFFADVCSVWAHQKYGQNDYVDNFESQLTEAAKTGHDVQLHIHPHWLFSEFLDGQWNINTDRMYMAELGYDGSADSATDVIRRGVDYLNNLFGKDSSGYQCLAFRAAGLALQPMERLLIGALLEHGIVIDSSIAKGLKFSSDTVTVDYTNMPAAANWYMSAESGLEKPTDNGLFEIPIATFQAGSISRIGFLWRRLAAARMRRGAGISRSARQTRWTNLKTMMAYNLRYLGGNPWFSLSCDTKGHNLEMLLDGLNKYLKLHKTDRPIFLSMINHPKLMFDQQFELLGRFIERTRKIYGSEIRYITFRQAYELIESQKDSHSP